MALVTVELTGCASFSKGTMLFKRDQPKTLNLSEEQLQYLKGQNKFKFKFPGAAKAAKGEPEEPDADTGTSAAPRKSKKKKGK